MKKSQPNSSWILLILGVVLYTLVTWKWNVPIATWLAPIFLMRYFRQKRRWIATLPAILLLWAASYANKTGVWGMEPWLEVALLGISALPIIFGLYMDRLMSSPLRGVWSTLVFPAAFVSMDYAVSFLPLGTVFSFSPTQLYIQPLVQIAAITGIWGIEFLVLWAAPVINALWENEFDAQPVRIPVIAYVSCLMAVLLYGGLRVVFLRPVTTTVRTAGITVAHARNYWDDIIDKGTPRALVENYFPEMHALTDQLFVESEKAAGSGAKVIFWSEADAFIFPGQEEAFMERARNFARQYQVFFMPAFQILRYGDTSGFNGLAMFTPEGKTAYGYEKTKSWYATTSDGLLHSVATPYGRIGSVVCFDLDFPALIRQAAQQNTDILLVPAFDTYKARVYHTEVGVLRGIEDGFSVFRMTNEGTSMAIDYRGSVLATQDFFTTPSRILIVDLPIEGTRTIYGRLGDWFAWLCIALVFGCVLYTVLNKGSLHQN